MVVMSNENAQIKAHTMLCWSGCGATGSFVQVNTRAVRACRVRTSSTFYSQKFPRWNRLARGPCALSGSSSPFLVPGQTAMLKRNKCETFQLNSNFYLLGKPPVIFICKLGITVTLWVCCDNSVRLSMLRR